jgi:hypothetical protein
MAWPHRRGTETAMAATGDTMSSAVMTRPTTAALARTDDGWRSGMRGLPLRMCSEGVAASFAEPTCPTKLAEEAGVVDVIRRRRPGPGYEALAATRREGFSRRGGVVPAANSVVISVGLVVAT